MAATEETLADAIERVISLPNGRPMASVLNFVMADVGNASVKVSADFHRATIALANDKQIAVRVTVPRPTSPGSIPKFRFKRPSSLYRYTTIYFGGLGNDGEPVIHKRTPAEIGSLQTISLPCGR